MSSKEKRFSCFKLCVYKARIFVFLLFLFFLLLMISCFHYSLGNHIGAYVVIYGTVLVSQFYPIPLFVASLLPLQGVFNVIIYSKKYRSLRYLLPCCCDPPKKRGNRNSTTSKTRTSRPTSVVSATSQSSAHESTGKYSLFPRTMLKRPSPVQVEAAAQPRPQAAEMNLRVGRL